MKKHLLAALIFCSSSTAFAAEQFCLSDICLFDTIDKFQFDGVKWPQTNWSTYPICDVQSGRVQWSHYTPDGERAGTLFEYIPGATKGAHFQISLISIPLPRDITKEQGDALEKQLVKRMNLQYYTSNRGWTSDYRAKTQGGVVTLVTFYPKSSNYSSEYSVHLKYTRDNSDEKSWENQILAQPGCKKADIPKL